VSWDAPEEMEMEVEADWVVFATEVAVRETDGGEGTTEGAV
jgi:hypothetical protein